MTPAQIIEKLTTILLGNSLIRGFVLVGSQARQTVYGASKYSDAEAYLIVENNDVRRIEGQLPGIVNQLGRVLFSYRNQWSGFSTVFANLFRLELPIAKMSELESMFSRPKAQEVKVLIDKTGGQLESALDKRPATLNFEQFFKDKVTDFWYMLILGVQYYKKGEIWNSRSALQILQSSLIKLFELLNDSKILLLETNKQIEQFLLKEQIELLKEVSPTYQKEDIRSALKKIAEIFSEASSQVRDKYHFLYDEQIENEVKPRLMKILDA